MSNIKLHECFKWLTNYINHHYLYNIIYFYLIPTTQIKLSLNISIQTYLNKVTSNKPKQ